MTYRPLRDMEFGFQINLRNPDDIALEQSAPNELLIAAEQALAKGRPSRADINAFVQDNALDPPSVDERWTSAAHPSVQPDEFLQRPESQKRHRA